MSARRDPRPVVVYGATGYTGRLIVEQLVAARVPTIAAGRNRERLDALAAAMGGGADALPVRAAAIGDVRALAAMAEAAALVLNAAGPFVHTTGPLVEACIAAGTPYLDVTGELEVVTAIAARGEAAAARGVMLLPCVGFDVVASDCLAAHVVRRLPDATRLRIGIDVPTPLSRGSLRTGFAHATTPPRVRRGGRLEPAPAGSYTHRFDFGDGPAVALGVALCDVVAAHHSTGVADIAGYARATPALWATLATMRWWGPLLAHPAVRAATGPRLDALPEGPSGAARARGGAAVVVEGTSAAGRRAVSRLRTPEAYTMTAAAAAAIAQRVRAGDGRPGFQTPAAVFGADFVLGIAGVSREDL